MRSPLLAGLLSVSLFATQATAAPRDSPWSASILAGPVTVQTPGGEEPPDEEFTVRGGVSRRIIGTWEAGIEAGYVSFGHFFDPFDGDGRLSYGEGGRALNSFDFSCSARWHPNFATFHPYLAVGAGEFAIQEYFPAANPSELSRQIKPGVSVGLGVHGVLWPALGFEFRWLTIYDGTGPENDRNKDIKNFMFTLTRE